MAVGRVGMALAIRRSHIAMICGMCAVACRFHVGQVDADAHRHVLAIGVGILVGDGRDRHALVDRRLH
jgi:hypothetical protein